MTIKVLADHRRPPPLLATREGLFHFELLSISPGFQLLLATFMKQTSHAQSPPVMDAPQAPLDMRSEEEDAYESADKKHRVECWSVLA